MVIGQQMKEEGRGVTTEGAGGLQPPPPPLNNFVVAIGSGIFR